MAGERSFSARYGYPINDLGLPGGDGGFDFGTWLGAVDVKTYRRPAHLLVEAGKSSATVYVLAWYDDTVGTASLLGWATREEALAASPRDVGGFGVRSHAIPAARLRSLASLDARLGARCAACDARVVGPTPRRSVGTDARRLGADFLAICPDCAMVGFELIET